MFIVEMLAEICKKSDDILDLGAFTGALLARIKNCGFDNLTASDLVNHLVDSNVDFVAADFNTDFSMNFGDKKFDCIVACEVIEHLDDPRKFLAQCAYLLRPNGIVIVSTPNIGFFEGRIKFLLTGEMWGYGAKNYRVQRHISPISREQFPLIYEECGFELIENRTCGSFATFLRKVLTAPIWAPMLLIFGRDVIGESRVAIGRKSISRTNDMSSEALWGTRRGASS